MKKKLIYLFVSIVLLMTGTIYGILIYRYQFFPYNYIQTAYYYFLGKVGSSNPWEIGIYKGPTPFDLSDPEDISNPVLTREDITDIDTRFIADPFMFIENDKYAMFFELLNLETNQGDIGYAESEDGITWKYQGIAIDEPFHLSYPYVFKVDNEYYLVPESTNDLSVRLYRATAFPYKWEYIGNLVSGHHYVDPSIFYYDNKWWLFVYSHVGILNLYYSDNLFSGWIPHPQNPIVKFNDHIARPGGRVFTYKGKLYRPAQDCDPTYGLQVFAHEIIELSKDHYKEELASEKPIVSFTGKGWNAGRMHHVDLHKVGEEWIAVVDGKNK